MLVDRASGEKVNGLLNISTFLRLMKVSAKYHQHLENTFILIELQLAWNCALICCFLYISVKPVQVSSHSFKIEIFLLHWNMVRFARMSVRLWRASCMCLCFSGRESAGPPWTELIHTAPHTGLLSTGWSGSAAWPGKIVWNDPEEEEDAPTQQEEEMKGGGGGHSDAGDEPRLVWWTTQLSCLWHLCNFSGWNQRESWQFFREAVTFPINFKLKLWRLCPWLTPSLVYFGQTCFLGDHFLLLSTHHSPHLQSLKEHGGETLRSTGKV